MRWRQVWDEEAGKYVMVPRDEAARRGSRDGIIVKGKFDAFQSPIDGTAIRTQRQYEDHCKKHNVVPSAEFSPEFYERKAKEREKFFKQEHTPEERWRRRAEINEIINTLERR